MIRVFRSLATKIAAVIFAVLMVVFVVTSVDWSQVTGGSRTTVGEIDGVRIPLQAYQQMVQNQTQAQQQQSGASLTAEEVEEIRNQVWDDLVQQQSLESAFRARGIKVSSAEVGDAIASTPPQEFYNAPDFQTDGKFDINKYHQWLRSSAAQIYVPQLEAQYTDQLRRSKLFRVITADIYIPDAELWQSWRDSYEKVTVEAVSIDPRRAVADSAVPITEAEARAYYDGHKDLFKRPATAYLSYVQLPRIADASDTAAAREHIARLRQEIVSGTPFAEVAKRESSDTASGSKGGDLGEFGKGEMDPAFEKAAFSLPVGVLSEPVLSSSGFHLIKVAARKGDKVTASHILVPVAIVGAHRDQLDGRVDSLEALGAERLEGSALDAAATGLGLRVGKAEPLQKGGRVQVGLQLVPDAGLWAFQAKPGETSRVIETSYAWFLFRVDSTTAEGLPPFDQIKDAATSAARQDRKREVAKTIGADLIKRIAEGSTISQAATALNLPHEKVGPFTRIQPAIPMPQVIGASFGIPEGMVSKLIDTGAEMYVLQVLKKEPADSAEFEKKKEEFRNTQIRLATQNRVRSYLVALKDKVKVKDRRAEIFRTEAQAEASQAAVQGQRKS
jgi:peptidyl-prolyl cis-trans isomerase D